ncbi:DMT family transporter [Microbaculum marinisediminis]|uniref:Multidrug efflux SMR transporter n=1 Tax=Microbaculum marinisediminis TaxID=2931392 RepID=A0AAW5R276_9HYPH|nr:multidrug efflux SMR transporter [Microbaculum sp. A6E488]MCT8972650.1 multidrug efflux SMR transporter [Microbaculum sp. A6E488]
MPIHLVHLIVAIIAEVIATSALKASNGFTVLVPSIVVIVGYAIAFYFLALTLKVMPVGVTYAIWSGLGVVLVAMVGTVLYRQVPDVWAMLGIALIMAGVIVINLMSKTVTH